MTRSRRISRALPALAVVALLGSACGAQEATGRQDAGTQATEPTPIPVSQDQFVAHAEPSTATNPVHPDNLLAAAMVFDGGRRGLATYASLDGGATWHSNGLLPGAGLADDADVTVAFDSAGHGYVCGWVGTSDHPDQGGAYVWRTEDGGRTFGPPVRAAGGFVDHPGLAADPTVGSKNLYLAGTITQGSGLEFTRSTDAGRSFEPPRPIDARNGTQGRLPVVAAGPHGLVAVMYFVFQPDGSAVPTVAVSTDHGSTFGAPHPLGTVQLAEPTAGVQARSGPALAVDPRSGTIAAAVESTEGTTSSLKVFASRDQGREWISTTVSRLGTGTYAQPQLHVDSQGRLGLFAFRIGARTVTPVLFVTAGSRELVFDRGRALTSTGFTPQGVATVGSEGTRAGSTSPLWIGDYQALTSDGGRFLALWNEPLGSHMQLVTVSARG